MNDDDEIPESVKRLFSEREPGRMIGRGHPAGDLLEAYEWRVLAEEPGHLRIACHLPDALRNPRGVLFGGFTATYVDLAAIFSCRAGEPAEGRRHWLDTVNMRIDYIEPITDAFEIDNRVVTRRGRMVWVESRFLDRDERMLAFALTTLREAAG